MKTLVLDFDGVLNSYKSGWQGFSVILDEPNLGALEFCQEAVKHFEVHVYSSRCIDSFGMEAIVEWLNKFGFPSEMRVSNFKPSAWLTIDDRCFLFKGTFPTIEEINNFKPWNK